MTHVVIASLVSLAVGYLAQLGQSWLQSSYINEFLRENLLTILIALLAINSATTGIVLTKIRELVEAHGNGHIFSSTRHNMVLAVKEQAWLIVIGIVALTVQSSGRLALNADARTLIDAVIVGVFVYGLHLLYDTSMSVMNIIDFDPKGKPS